MRELCFDVFIGLDMVSGQTKNIIAVVNPKMYIPRGNYYIDGEQKLNGLECFINLYDLGTYFADWIELIGCDKCVKATIHLNIQSLHRDFIGNDIITLIDKLNVRSDWQSIRSFNELK